MLKRLKNSVLNYLLKHLYCAIISEDFLQIKFLDKQKKTGVLIEGGEELTRAHTVNLASEARTIRQLEIYRKVMQSMKYCATEALFLRSKTTDDMIFGKAMLYTLDVLDTKLKNIGEL